MNVRLPWASGDWNSDGEFDSQDIVVAFQDGAYTTEARAYVIAAAIEGSTRYHPPEYSNGLSKIEDSIQKRTHAHYDGRFVRLVFEHLWNENSHR